MGSLAEFVKKEAAHLKSEAQKRGPALQEWKEAIDRFYATLTKWIDEADDGQQLLRYSTRTQETCSESLLGAYVVPMLSIGFGYDGFREVYVVPRARYVSSQVKYRGELRRVDGLMEIRDHQTPVYYLFRIKSDQGDEWYVRSVVEWNADDEYGNAYPLDRDRFESALLSLFK